VREVAAEHVEAREDQTWEVMLVLVVLVADASRDF
jgi:hypothetical protein